MAQPVKNLPGEESWVKSLGQEESPGERNGCLPQYSCLENPMDRGAWKVLVHRVAESDTTERPTLSALRAWD